MLLKKANTITTPTAYSNGFLHSVKPEVVWETFYESDFSVPYTGFISNLIGTTGESIAGVNDAIKLTLNNGLANHDIVPILNNVPLLNLDIRLSFDYYIPSTNAQLNGIFNFNTFSSSSHPNLRFQEIDKWTSVVVTGKTVTSGNVDLYFRALSGTSQTFSADGDVFYLKNIKVEIDISADFTFTRNSSATRVNELGYIEDVQIIGGELVSNGDFEEIGSELVTNGSFDTDSDWLKLNSTISDGKGNLDGTGVTSMLYQGILTNGLFYKATFTISNYNLIGNADIINASGVPYYVISSEGTFTIYFKHNDASSNFYFRARNGAIFSIDNVSVKEVGQDWIVLDTDATHYVEFSEEGARYVSDTTSPVLTLRQNISITSGTKYRFTIKLKNNGGTGNIKVQQTGITFVPNILDGTYTEDIVATANVTAVNIVRASTDVDLYIESFSIKEVTDDTNLPRINYEGFTYAESLGDNLVVNGTFDNTNNWTAESGVVFTANGIGTITSNGSFSGIRQSIDITFGKTYRVSIKHRNTTSAFRFYVGNTGYETIPVSSDFTTTTLDIVANGTVKTLYILVANASSTIEVDNVSVQEVIGDLPVPYSGKGHLLLEPQRTNSFTYSESFADYYINRCDKTDLGPMAIRSSGSIARFTANAAAAYFGKTISSLSSGSTYTISAFFDITEGIYAGIRDASSNTAIFNILTGELIGTIGTLVASCTSTQVDSSNYHRVAFTFTATITGTHYFVIGTSSGTINTTNETIAAGYFQREDGSTYVTSYIPTNGTSVTRLGETCNNATQSFPSEGVLYAEIAALADDGSLRRIYISDGSSSDRIMISYNTGSNFIRCFVIAGGVISCDFQTALTNILDFHKIAIRYKENDFSLWIDGEQLATDVSGSVPTGLNDLAFDALGLYNFYGKTKMVATFPYLSNDEMECLTGQGYGTFEALAAAYSYTIK